MKETVKIHAHMTYQGAVLPSRATPQDIGYDLTAISVVKKYGTTTLYDTGVTFVPPEGFYAKIFARSSLIKTGHMIANGVGIVDPEYRGTLKIAIVKVDPDADDLVLPFKKAQLVLEEVIPSQMQISVFPFDDTPRGGGGFGSTD